MAVKPPLPYFGSKQRIAPKIVSLFPPHGHYVEPYCGSLSVLLAKQPSPMETVNDLDGDLMTFWRVLRDQPDELMRVCELTPHSRAEFAAAAHPEEAATDLDRARKVWVALTQHRVGRRRRDLLPSDWKMRTSPAALGTPNINRTYASYVRRMPPAAERLAHVSLECRPALDVITQYGRSPDVLLYVDPPYLGSTRNEQDRYLYELRDDTGHQELAATLTSVAASVVLSGYHSPLYDDLYAGWHVQEIAGSDTTGSIRTEVLWSNRPLGVQPSLFDDMGDLASIGG